MPNATVLVVDDEPLIRWSLINRLKEEGYRTLEAGTAGDAVAQHRDGADLVLLDFALPDANGLDVLKQIKETDPDTLVIMLTANTEVGTAVAAMKQGAFHYANKPFDLDEIMMLVEKALERRSCAVSAIARAPAQPWPKHRRRQRRDRTVRRCSTRSRSAPRHRAVDRQAAPARTSPRKSCITAARANKPSEHYLFGVTDTPLESDCSVTNAARSPAPIAKNAD